MYGFRPHVGPHETATGSFRCNVPMPLRERRRIDLPGRSMRDGKGFDPFEGVLDRIGGRADCHRFIARR